VPQDPCSSPAISRHASSPGSCWWSFQGNHAIVAVVDR
jgi:hypothetical protein